MVILGVSGVGHAYRRHLAWCEQSAELRAPQAVLLPAPAAGQGLPAPARRLRGREHGVFTSAAEPRAPHQRRESAQAPVLCLSAQETARVARR